MQASGIESKVFFFLSNRSKKSCNKLNKLYFIPHSLFSFLSKLNMALPKLMYTAAHEQTHKKTTHSLLKNYWKRKSLYRKNNWENISGNKKAEKLDSQSLIRNRLYIRDLIEESDEEAVWKSFYNERFSWN